MTQEVRNILHAGYEMGKHYKIQKTENGFILKSEDDEQKFDLRDYNEHLNLNSEGKGKSEKTAIPKKTAKAASKAESKPNEKM